MRIDRRDLLSHTSRAVLAAALAALIPVRAEALGTEEARSHVESTIKEVIDLVKGPGDIASKSGRLLDIIKRRAALPEIARFAAGVAWRTMSPDQQTRYTAAFGQFVAGVYAGRFEEYTGQSGSNDVYRIDRVVDAGRKGMLVQSSILRPNQPPVAVDWLVSDQPGRIVIADIVIEGVSMLITQREEIGGMLEARGGDVEKLISDLARA